MNIFHQDYQPVDGIHVPHFKGYANEASRLVDITLLTTDIHKVALQLDNNRLYILVDTTPTWVDIGQGPQGPPGMAASTAAIVGFVPQRWYDNTMCLDATGASSYTLDTIRAIPFLVDQTTTFDVIAVEQTNSAVGNGILGIYTNDGNASGPGLPGTLLLDAGQFDTSTPGLKQIAINQSLTPGWWWLTHCQNSSRSLRRYAGIENLDIGFTTGLDTAKALFVSVVHPFAPLPNPFGTPTFETGNTPRILLKVM